MQQRQADRYWQDSVADTLCVQLHTINQYIWMKGHPGKQPPHQKITLYSEIAHKAARKPKKTDRMTADQITKYIVDKL